MSSSNPDVGCRYVIAGGGCYGADYVRQLLRANERGAIELSRILVIDEDPDCDVFEAYNGHELVEPVVAEWCAWIDEWWPHRQEFAGDRWVPPPLAPHILFHWVLRLARSVDDEWRATSWPTSKEPEGFEFASAIPNGSLALSHAPGTCPVHCIEPETCPLTKGTRTWEMKESVRSLFEDAPGEAPHVSVFRCQHHAYGVGTIPFDEIVGTIEEALTHVTDSVSDRIAVATVSSCHGIVDLLERNVELSQPADDID
jgi:hypothetical protein